MAAEPPFDPDADRFPAGADRPSLEQAIIQSASQLVIATDPAGVIIDLNPAAEAALGYSRDELIGKATPEIFHDKEELAAAAARLQALTGAPVEAGLAAILEAALGGLGEAQEWIHVRKDGSRFPVLLSVTPLRDPAGRLTGYVGIGTDLTARKRAEAAVAEAALERRARSAAEQASAAKSRFLAAASHDLRQPLHALSLFLNVLVVRLKEPDLRDVARKALDALNIGEGLLAAMAEIANLDAGLIRPRPFPFPVQTVLDPLIAELRGEAATKGIGLRAVRSSLTVHSDPALLQRLLRLLLENAVRHTAGGRVLVGCRRHPQGILVAIHDTGPGIADDKLELIFEDFYQIDNAARDRSRGLGLGLSIAERIARLLGHHIGVASRPGAGSAFTVLIPYRTAP